MPCVHRGFRDITFSEIDNSHLADRICHDWYSEREHSLSGYFGVQRQWNVPLCRTCGGAPKWFVYMCTFCSTLFIKDFSDPRFCFCESYCWDHLSEGPFSPTKGCLEHASSFSLGLGTVAPSGLNARLIGITEEEYTDILSELGIDF